MTITEDNNFQIKVFLNHLFISVSLQKKRLGGGRNFGDRRGHLCIFMDPQYFSMNITVYNKCVLVSCKIFYNKTNERIFGNNNLFFHHFEPNGTQ